MFVITLLGDFDEEVGTTYIQVRQHTASLSVLLGGGDFDCNEEAKLSFYTYS